MKNDADLRVVKTLANIRESLVALLRKKTISEITVKEICDGAQCSRNTFYMHYPYKEALYEQIVDESIAKVRYGFRPLDRLTNESDREYIDRGIHNFVAAIFDAREMLNVIIASDSTNTFCCRLTNAVREALLASGTRLSPEAADSDTYRLIARYCTGGVVNFMLGCYQDADVSVPEAENLLRALHSVPFAVGSKYLEEHK